MSIGYSVLIGYAAVYLIECNLYVKKFYLNVCLCAQFQELKGLSVFPGVCLCASGWSGSDCSVDVQVGPRVGSLANNGLCDVRNTIINI